MTHTMNGDNSSDVTYMNGDTSEADTYCELRDISAGDT